MTTQMRVVMCLGLLLAAGCDEPEEDLNPDAQATGAVGKADGIGSEARVTWNTLESSGCTASGVVNDPHGNGYASTWLFQDASVTRCSLRGSATFPAGVVVRRMNVSGEGYIASSGGDAIPSVVVDVRGSSGQAVLQGATLRQAPTGEDNVTLFGTEALSMGCLTAPTTVRFRTDFAVGEGTLAQFDSLDVQFDVEGCGG